MGVGGDLAVEALAEQLPDRPLRSYPALLSTHADALAWARAGAAAGSLVVADYQVAPRGRAGLPWSVQRGRGLGCSLILRPADLQPEREGWLYAVAVSGLADAIGTGAAIRWPDEVWVDGQRRAATGVHVQLGPQRAQWAVVTVLVEGVAAPRGPHLARVVAALEQRAAADPAAVLADYRPRCATLGRTVRARLIPMGPSGPQVLGRADDVLEDGALVIVTGQGHRVAVRPQNLGLLEELETAPDAPAAGAGQDPQAGAGQDPQSGVGQDPQSGVGQDRQAGVGQDPQAGAGQDPQAGAGPAV